MLPRDNNFYRELFYSIREGFEEIGVSVIGSLDYLTDFQLNEYCRENKISAVIEMNRSRNERPELDKNIIHISWVVDLRGHSLDYYQDSEITYFFNSDWSEVYNSKSGQLYDWLAPGFDPKRYRILTTKDKKSDMSFVGHIPNPWNNDDLSRIVDENNNIRFSSIVDDISEQCEKNGGWRSLTGKEYIALVHGVMRKYTGKVYFEDTTLRYDTEVRTSRILSRTDTIDMALEMSQSLRIYGSENWKNWPRYKSKYVEYLNSSEAINNVFHSSKLNLHDGVGFHFRSINCIGSGAPLLYRHRPVLSGSKGALWNHFDPGKHFLLLDDDVHGIEKYLHNPKGSELDLQKARYIALSEHSWRARANQIMSDIRKK
ncbi:MAG: glycosyltransferase [Sedimenticola sp.]